MQWFTLLVPILIATAAVAQQQESSPTPSTSNAASSAPASSTATSTASPTSTSTSTSSTSSESSSPSSMADEATMTPTPTASTTTMSFLTHFSALAHGPSSSSLSSFHPTQSAPYPDDTVGKYGPLHVSLAAAPAHAPWLLVVPATLSAASLLLSCLQ